MNSSTKIRQREGSADGFTLIEVLVACAILVVLVVLVAQMVNSASILTKDSSRRMDADDEARMVFDRMGEDFAQMMRRSDVNPLLLPTNGNDQLYFYSQAPGIGALGTTNSQISLVGYEVMTNGLARLGIQQAWDDLAFTNNIAGLPSWNTVTNSTNYHIIAPSVFRMEFALRMKSGGTNNTNGLGPTPLSPVITMNGSNVVYQTNNSGQGLQDVEAIIVTLAILDQTSQEIVTASKLTNLAGTDVMPDASTSPVTAIGAGVINGSSSNGIPADAWLSNALSNNLGIPQAAKSQIRIYQRTFPISP